MQLFKRHPGRTAAAVLAIVVVAASCTDRASNPAGLGGRTRMRTLAEEKSTPSVT